MKFLRFIVIFLGFLGTIYIVYTHFFSKSLEKAITPIAGIIEKPTVTPTAQTTALFVPYWTLQSTSLDKYDSYIYFGITANTTGINTSESGFLNLEKFAKVTTGEKKILVLRLLDEKINDMIFTIFPLKQKIIQESIAVAKKYGFSGIAVDLEYPSLAFTPVTQNISDVITNFSAAVKKENLQSFVTMYGDTFYRIRPFNVKEIGKQVDGIFIMAYDFHKAKGNPGPNFPLETGEDETYSFKIMIDDFSAQVPKDKLTVIFGMFGYDWKVSEKGISLTDGQPLSTSDIEKSFLASCSQKSCVQARNAALEPSVSYIDNSGSKHTIWYEDTKSVEKKTEYLQTKGIGSTAIWANGYF